MKKLILVVLALPLVFSANAQALETFHDFEANTILGETISLSQFAGKKLLVVNTASYCGYTPQFDDLEALDSTYEANNFEVIGFPCNDFGGQDPHTDAEILDFCSATYGVTFQMMAKVPIVLGDTAEVYKWLQKESRNGVSDAAITWNFHKFCIDEYGHWVMHFPSTTLPFDQQIVDWILSETPTAVTETNIQPEFSVRCSTLGNYLTVILNDQWNSKGSVALYSIEGKQVDMIHTGFLNNNMEMRYDISALPAGVYLVNAVANGISKSQRVCVVR